MHAARKFYRAAKASWDRTPKPSKEYMRVFRAVGFELEARTRGDAEAAGYWSCRADELIGLAKRNAALKVARYYQPGRH